MDVFHDPQDTAARFGRPVDDLRRLLAFHGLRSGAPEYLAAFARKLEESKPFRTDLTALLRSTRDLEHGRLTSDQILAIVAVAIGGEALLADPAASPATTHTITLVLMLLAGIGGWSDTGGRAAADPVRSPVPPSAPREPSPPLKSRFAVAQTSPPRPETPAMDVRAFVRSEAHSEARSDNHSETPFETRPNNDPTPHKEALPDLRPERHAEARTDTPHVLRREPLSEIVRTSAPPAPSPARSSDPDRRPTPPQHTISDPTFARSPATTLIETRLPPDRHPRPEPRLRPATSQTWPDPRAATESQPQPFTPPRPTADFLSSDRQASTPASPAEAPAAPMESTAPDRDSWHTDQPDLSPSPTRRPVSRKLALDALLATAAVGLLLFGIFEGLHARHAAPATTTMPSAESDTRHTPPQTTSAAAALPQPTNLAPPQPTTPTSTLTATPADPAPSTAPPPAAHPHTAPPTRTTTAEALPPATPAASHPAAPEKANPRPTSLSTLTRTADLRTTDLQVPPHGPVAVPESTMNGQLLATRKPVYPPSALAQNIGGTVVLRAFISADGTIRRTDVLSGPPPLINSALAAASWRRYRPFVAGGHPVEVQTEITFHYAAP